MWLHCTPVCQGSLDRGLVGNESHSFNFTLGEWERDALLSMLFQTTVLCTRLWFQLQTQRLPGSQTKTALFNEPTKNSTAKPYLAVISAPCCNAKIACQWMFHKHVICIHVVCEVHAVRAIHAGMNEPEQHNSDGSTVEILAEIDQWHFWKSSALLGC